MRRSLSWRTYGIFSLGFGNLQFPVGQSFVGRCRDSVVARVTHSARRQNGQIRLAHPRDLQKERRKKNIGILIDFRVCQCKRGRGLLLCGIFFGGFHYIDPGATKIITPSCVCAPRQQHAERRWKKRAHVAGMLLMMKAAR